MNKKEKLDIKLSIMKEMLIDNKNSIKILKENQEKNRIIVDMDLNKNNNKNTK